MSSEAQAPVTSPTLQDRVREIFRAFEAQGAPGAVTTTRYRLELGGAGTGAFLLEVAPDGVRWSNADEQSGDVTIRIDTSDFLAIAEGSLDGRLALASEKIELDGDLGAATLMKRLFFPAESDS